MTRLAHNPAVAGLLTALREAGLAVDMTHIERLRRVFSLEPPGHRLASVLRAVLVKSASDRARFDQVYDAWIEGVELRVDAMQHSHRPILIGGTPVTEREPMPAGRAATAAAIIAPVVVYALLVSWALTSDQAPSDLPVAPDPVEKRPIAADDDAGPLPEQPSACAPAALRDANYRFTTAVPILKSIGEDPVWTGWWPLGLGLFGLLAAGLGWRQLRRPSTIPARQPPVTGSGPSRALLEPMSLRSPALLDARQQESMVWGIGRFVSEQPTRHLDIAATVRDTAKNAGIPRLQFRRARYHREIWLWVDEQADDPTIARLAREIAAVLRQSGLPAEEMIFRGVPDRLRVVQWAGHDTGHGQEFTSAELYDRRHTATVAILTDARVFLARYRHHHKRRIDSVLRELSHWPRLALVDCSAGPGDLALIAASHDIEVIGPDTLASFLGQSQAGSRASDLISIDAWQTPLWAAACAVSPGSVAEDTAVALRRQLELQVPPWSLAALRNHAASPGGRLHVTQARRIEQLHWLREAQDPELGIHGQRTDGPRGWLDRAIEFWRDHYAAEDRRRLDDDPDWQPSPARRQLEIERALLDLWRDPVAAAHTLHDRFEDPHQSLIKQHLEAFAPADSPAAQKVRTLWTVDQCPAVELAMLQAMGFAAGVQGESLRKPGRLWLGVSWIAGLALGALVVAARLWAEPPAEPVIADLGRADAWHHIERDSDGWQVRVATPHSHASLRVPPGALVNVRWQNRALPCVTGLDNGELWRCGAELQQPRPGRSAPGRLVSVIDAGEQAGDQAIELALALLDCSDADMVYIGPAEGWAADRVALVGDRAGQEQITSIPDGDMASRLGQLRVDRKCGSLVMFSAIPGGTFWMGIQPDDRDPMAGSDETSARQVTLRPFWLARCEVSNHQYRAFVEATGRSEPAYWQDARYNQPGQPVVGVSWHDAGAYCQYFGHDLPTEAQWEYACRGGNERGPWPAVKGGEARLGDYAWYDKNSGGQTHLVGTKKATAFGLHDMHGNVDEWLRDWYAPYPTLSPGQCDEDPAGPPEADAPVIEFLKSRARLLRGGAFDDVARDVRCAIRYWFDPSIRSKDVGFRCVRGVRRQP
ncbi:MAG: formylglycine-generating enzyme family protein [Proteobacteria bacterium]|nr:formylglycine-generating enzyme family protein [Pseudomonadota bacterium]